ncbi:hypothetical protein [Aeromonas caviae]|uniref:hypothetical protein n=1 Tax=Aeromonas caviae TaxID=648 RepID=UPI003F743633
MKKIYFIQASLLLMSFIMSWLSSGKISSSDLTSLLSTLQNISAAVFTIAGIWIAYIYPEAISSFTNPDKIALIKGTESTEQVKSLVFTVITSASVLTCTLLFGVLSLLYKNSDLVIENKGGGCAHINNICCLSIIKSNQSHTRRNYKYSTIRQ